MTSGNWLRQGAVSSSPANRRLGGFARTIGLHFLCGLLPAMFAFSAPAHAAIALNPGGSSVVTNSTTAGISYVDTPVVTRVDDFATTLLILLNGSQISSQSFLVAYSDPTVQSAVASADSILTGDGASFGAPIQDSSIITLISSIAGPPPPTYSCANFANGTVNYPPGSSVLGSFATTANTFGPATVAVGSCLEDTFTVLAGQLDINVNTENDFSVARTITTTNTFLTTATYEIDGLTSAVAGVPELATWTMLLLGFGGIGFMLRENRRKEEAVGLK